VRCTESGRCSKCRCGQAAKCYVAAFGAFEDLPGDTPTNPVFFSPNGKPLAGPFKGHFHIGQRPGIKAFSNHDCFLHRVAAKPPGLGFGRSATFCKKYALQIRGIPQNARLLHCLVSLGAGRHRARLFQGRQRFGFQIKFGPQVFVLSGHGAKIRQSIPACLFVARLWNPSGNRWLSHRNTIGAIEAASLNRRRRETLAFRRRY
jgi:hypothetical protein